MAAGAGKAWLAGQGGDRWGGGWRLAEVGEGERRGLGVGLTCAVMARRGATGPVGSQLARGGAGAAWIRSRTEP